MKFVGGAERNFLDMRRTQSLKHKPTPSSLPPVEVCTTYDDLDTTCDDLEEQFKALHCSSRRRSVDSVRLLQGSKDFQAALEDIRATDSPEEKDEHSGTAQKDQDPAAKPEKAPGRRGSLSIKATSPRFLSKDAERICIKNLHVPYPKFMTVHRKVGVARSEGDSISPAGSSPSSPASCCSPGDKRVTFGDVFTFENTTGSNPQLPTIPDVAESPPRLRRVVSAKTRRPNKKIH